MTPEEQSIHLVGRLAKLERELQETRSDLEFRRGLYTLQAERVERLERELEQEREQITILRSDEKRLIQFTKTYRLRADEAEAERHHAKEEVARLKATLADPAEVELAMIRGDIAIPDRVEFDGIRDTPSGYNPLPTDAEIDAHLDECLARSEESWKPLPGDPKVFYPQP
jgi:hypothetical protein